MILSGDIGSEFSRAASELSPSLTLGTLKQIHKEFKGSGNGLLTALKLYMANFKLAMYLSWVGWWVSQSQFSIENLPA